MEAIYMPALMRLLGKLLNPTFEPEIWPQREWCCRSCADAYLLGRLAEAARAREQLKAS
jgi:hypothetical protein